MYYRFWCCLLCVFCLAVCLVSAVGAVPSGETVSDSPVDDTVDVLPDDPLQETLDSGAGLPFDNAGDGDNNRPVTRGVPSGILSGGYYFVADCAFGSDLRFYIPSDYSADALAFDASGNVVNLTCDTVYLYCPSYPNYSIYASRFSTFVYRPSSGYNYSECNFDNVAAGSVLFLSGDSPRISVQTILIVLCALVLLFGCILCFVRRR